MTEVRRGCARTGRRTGGRTPRRLDERGIVTAELAMGLPLLVAVTIGLVWLLSVGLAEIRVVDAAREAARSAARGDDPSTAVAAARHVAPGGSEVSVHTDAGLVTVQVSTHVAGPGGLFAFLPGVTVRASATGATEDDPAAAR